jgi:hypothetical protein
MKFLSAYQLLQSTGRYIITPPAKPNIEVYQENQTQKGTEAESTVQASKE